MTEPEKQQLPNDIVEPVEMPPTVALMHAASGPNDELTPLYMIGWLSELAPTWATSSAMMAKASSHEMRTHSSRPRSSFWPPVCGSQCLRFMGYFKRSAPKVSCRCAWPRGQARIWGFAEESSVVSSVFWRTTMPSTT